MASTNGTSKSPDSVRTARRSCAAPNSTDSTTPTGTPSWSTTAQPTRSSTQNSPSSRSRRSAASIVKDVPLRGFRARSVANLREPNEKIVAIRRRLGDGVGRGRFGIAQELRAREPPLLRIICERTYDNRPIDAMGPADVSDEDRIHVSRGSQPRPRRPLRRLRPRQPSESHEPPVHGGR